ncbi:hypothetical protein N4G70_27585 [Streptomyces sp. ASQP_92]|uniref:hypothetical protein n=1 Tax=Streptomyces sp. ASQP_92 TaxID=2979116 RepID=UPI0021BE2F79|nr:hypothetical protein [Streptomyces sp. ASQP_92]MCT9092602.1 hypothetical protein [Streptomyces sp. ASQP_92]
MSIAVVGAQECAGAFLERDEWIPMSVTWEPRSSGRPLYLRISGVNGGEVELKIDPLNGMLTQLIVIIPPPQVENRHSALPVLQVQGQAPVIDRSPWGWVETPDSAEPHKSIAETVENLGFIQDPDIIGVTFSDEAPARHVRCEGVTVGVSSAGSLVQITACL